MTHPYREELAGRLEEYARDGETIGKRVTLRKAAAALRQSPTVEEVAEIINQALCDGDGQPAIQEAAQAIDTLYKRGGG